MKTILTRCARAVTLWSAVAVLAGCAGATQRHSDNPEKLTPKEAWEKGTGLSPSTPTRSRLSAGFDARLSTYVYPFATKTFRTKAQEIPLEMVYMDVPAAQESTEQGVVMLLHGKNFSGAYWQSTIDALTAQGYRVIAPDQVGFGKSSKPDTFQYSFHQMAELTHALLTDELGISAPVHIVGHSMGGMLATRYALMYPQATRSMTLVNPIGLEDWKRQVPYQSVDGWLKNERKRDAERIKTYMTKAYFDGTWKPEYAPLVEIQAGWAEGPDRELMGKISALTYDMIFTQPVLYEFPDITSPTLLIIGQRDRTALGRGSAPEEVAVKMGRYDELGRTTQAAIPGSVLVELEGIGHVPQYEAFDAYINALTTYLPQH